MPGTMLKLAPLRAQPIAPLLARTKRWLALALIATSSSFTVRSALAQATPQQDSSALARAIAQAYGIDGWDQIEQIDFTFNVKSSNGTVSRQWTWRPHDDQVTLRRPDAEPITYHRRDLNFGKDIPQETPQEVIQADRQFINDSYWLLFPFQIAWSNPTLTDAGEAPLPIGQGVARKVIVQYPAQGGYTPGDAYDLYLDANHHIQQWVFRRGGGEKGSPITWQGLAQLGPILLHLEHAGPDGSVRLWFSNVQARLRDSDTPVTPQPVEP
ncbi:MAG TPA: hypothetical protein VF184_11910 [Phycisphaeraceae bacterium]